ncbi:carotenoid oxygenase family protein [Bradyrhizobium sp. U87765 SZCCT0131]|uniref:carotenoid oxygenase family protein n=1 Tax=unclassified Bradyrhizobium TaxID=2631580 RepID=UPI001BA9AD59|nr:MULTISPECIES: carotenoid oxygenase family protein [unclassified Bradyrhizobium]MBR1219845.1 carotenoid oxygenase family protein [Bradyrhizobium sp. U87765 SZCCT0131]MBR1262496.1 carotenoid oxygenase family protein [Bradyrhizobium sp. U87765 SZCCT0134]MBR1308321.1 carotenoid oxygenase family protein [Bradyrhizobium sp. U87765 SZCCT0110]MBR1318278.1 carotenoid oxygenase family protein [Bradyrhizobium sp. U87765 SZCCT0109]MBR1351981.1 carotenoid oxygenase family protein [Bradyrhizobium sp. U87
MSDPNALPPRSNVAPIPMECDAPFLKVEGELPRELNGTLYRNGPNPQFEAPGAHWFVGDGMLHAFHIENGRASYRNRWVRTPKWLAEHDAGRALFGGFGRRLGNVPEGTTQDSGVANTNIVFHAGRLLALEEGHMPTEIEPGTLATRGYQTYRDAIAGPFTAHPKLDPVTGEMVFFGYNAGGPFTPKVSYGVVGANGEVSQFERFDAPYASMVHDFIVTEKHVLFPILPLTGSMERAMGGRPPYAWEPDKGAYVGVMKRGGSTKDIIWFRGDSCYVFHVMNAWEDGQRIIADVMQFAEPPLFPYPDGRPTDPAKSKARLCRWTFDLSGGTDRFTQHYQDETTGEFPRIDDRHAGLAYRHGWYACGNPAGAAASGLSGIVHVDHKANRRAQYLLPDGDTISEPVFVERGAEAAEGDGWLIAAVWRARENRSDVAVFNAQDVESGPVALVKLGHRVPDGFHGNWVNGR